MHVSIDSILVVLHFHRTKLIKKTHADFILYEIISFMPTHRTRIFTRKASNCFNLLSFLGQNVKIFAKGQYIHSLIKFDDALDEC